MCHSLYSPSQCLHLRIRKGLSCVSFWLLSCFHKISVCNVAAGVAFFLSVFCEKFCLAFMLFGCWFLFLSISFMIMLCFFSVFCFCLSIFVSFQCFVFVFPFLFLFNVLFLSFHFCFFSMFCFCLSVFFFFSVFFSYPGFIFLLCPEVAPQVSLWWIETCIHGNAMKRQTFMVSLFHKL